MWQVRRLLPESMPPQRQQPIRPAPPARVVTLELDHLVYLCNQTPPRPPQPRQRGLRYYHNGSDAPAHAHTASHPVPTRLCCPIPLWFRSDGTRRNFLCGNILVRYTCMKHRPTPAELIAHYHNNIARTHCPTAYPSEPRPLSFDDYQLHPRD